MSLQLLPLPAPVGQGDLHAASQWKDGCQCVSDFPSTGKGGGGVSSPAIDWLVTMTACWKLSCRIAGPASCTMSFRSAPQVPPWTSSPLSKHCPLLSPDIRGSLRSLIVPTFQPLHWLATPQCQSGHTVTRLSEAYCAGSSNRSEFGPLVVSEEPKDVLRIVTAITAHA
jgi:hypothetical protein